jgi:hypothetical protein
LALSVFVADGGFTYEVGIGLAPIGMCEVVGTAVDGPNDVFEFEQAVDVGVGSIDL